MILQVQGMAIMSKLGSVKEDAPSFSGFAESFGMFNLEVQPPWDREGKNATEQQVLKDRKKELQNGLVEGRRRLSLLTNAPNEWGGGGGGFRRVETQGCSRKRREPRRHRGDWRWNSAGWW
jgi:hypothetical protein